MREGAGAKAEHLAIINPQAPTGGLWIEPG
jgi:hypothetical protein